MQDKTGILITGAGPVGLMMACQLVAQGISFRIIDKLTTYPKYSGALILQPGTLELFHQLGLADEAVKNGKVLKAVNFSFNGKHSIRYDTSHLGNGSSRFPFALMLEQWKTEKILYDFLSAHRVRVETGTVLSDFSEFSDHVVSQVNNAGREEVVYSEYLVAADGGHSTVRQKLEIPMSGTTHKKLLFATDCLATVNLPADEILISCSPEATTGYFPLGEGKWRIDGAFNWPDPCSDITFDAIKNDFMVKTQEQVVLHKALWFSIFKSQKRNALFYNTDRCFLVGDAAHVYSPVGAQGLNQGMQDTANLSWKLAFVMKKWGKPCILYSYEEERIRISKKTAGVSDRIYDLLASEKKFLKNMRLRLIPVLLKMMLPVLKSPVSRRYLFKNISGTGITYKRSSMSMNGSNTGNSKLRPGARMPFISFIHNGKPVTLTDLVKINRMHLFIFSKDSHGDFYHTVLHNFKNQVFVSEIEYNQDTRPLFIRLGIKKSTFFLVRPDLHIACRGNEPQRLEKYLYQILIPEYS